MTESDIGIVPRHAPDVILNLLDDVHLLTRNDDEPVVVDHVALALWELCDGETTVEEMALAAAAVFDAPQAQLQADISAALANLTQRGLLLWESAK